MILEARDLPDGSVLEADLAVVGAGPAGIVLALEAAKGGLDVVLLESGGHRPDPNAQRLGAAAEGDSGHHLPMSLVTRRQVGGASVIWGGRCVPYDPVDFDHRPFVPDGRWPISYEEVSRFFQRACDWFACGDASFNSLDVPGLSGRTLVPGLPDGDVRTSTLERWSLPTNFGREYRRALRHSSRIRLVTGLTCVEVVPDETAPRVAWLEMRTLDHRAVHVRARRHVLACGGLETTRLLLASRGHRAGGLGNHSGHLGRWYMGHVHGRIARASFSTPPRETIYSQSVTPAGSTSAAGSPSRASSCCGRR